MRVQDVNGELVHFRAARGFHHIINATTCYIGDASSDVLTAIVDHVGDTQLQGESETPGFNVDTDDRVGANEASRHDSGYADRSRTKDGDAFPA